MNTYTLPNSPQNVAVPTGQQPCSNTGVSRAWRKRHCFRFLPSNPDNTQNYQFVSALVPGSGNWSYQSNSQATTTIATAFSDNSLVLQDSELGLVPISSAGSAGAPVSGLQQASPTGSGKLVRFERSGNASIDGRASRFFGSSLAYSKRRASGKQEHYSSSCGEHYSD